MNEIVSADTMTDTEIIAGLKRTYDLQRFPNDVFSMVFGNGLLIKGSKGDKNGTFHEWLFASLFPELEKQVSFGTGKGGYEKWLSKCYIADFLDKKRKTIYEIDGRNHKNRLRQLKDELRTLFFREKGYRVIRYTNKQVEDIVLMNCRCGYGGLKESRTEYPEWLSWIQLQRG